MRVKCVLILLLLFPAVRQGISQKRTTLPFTLTEYNNMVVRAILNETDTLDLMFHTAASDLTLIEESVKRLKSLHFTSNLDSIKSWGGSANSARVSIRNTIRIGKLTWKDIVIIENKNSGQYTDGKFGLALFKGKVVEIDFDHSVIRLSDRLPKKRSHYQQVKIREEEEAIFLEGVCKTGDSAFTNSFMIHSGYAGALLFDDKFATDSRLGQVLKITGEKRLTDSYGNVIISKQAILPVFSILGFSLKDVPVGFFDGSIGRQPISVLGGDIIKRFNWVIDAARTYAYILPNSIHSTPYRKM